MLNLFIAKSSVGNQNKKDSVLYLLKEATSKDAQLKTQMVLSLQDDESKNTERIWSESSFIGDQRAELTILKANFPKNTLVLVNQGTVSLVKGGEKAIYLDFVIIGQLMPAANIDPKIDLDNYECKENEVILYIPVYNTATGLYGGLVKKLAYITLRGDAKEKFMSYGYSKENSSLLYCSMKKPLSIFNCTAFKKHVSFLLDENQNHAKFPNLFLYLSSTLHRKEEFLHWKDNVHLHPVDLTYDDIKQVAGQNQMDPSWLDPNGSNLCYVPKNMRNLVLNNFNQTFDLSTGFCTIKYWNVYIETNCFALCNDIFIAKYFDEKVFDPNFDFDENYFALLKSFKHFSLFSICLYFLRCVRYCDKK